MPRGIAQSQYIVFIICIYIETRDVTESFVGTERFPKSTWIMSYWDKQDERTWTTPNGHSPSQLPDESLKLFLQGTRIEPTFEKTVNDVLVQFFDGVSSNTVPIRLLQKYFSSQKRCSDGRSAWTAVGFHGRGAATLQKNLSVRAGLYAMANQLTSLPSSPTVLSDYNSNWVYPIWTIGTGGRVSMEFR